MLEALAVVLLVVWAIGLASSYTMGGLLHLLLVAALVVIGLRVSQVDFGPIPLSSGAEPRSHFDGWFNAWAGAIAISGLLLRVRRKGGPPRQSAESDAKW